MFNPLGIKLGLIGLLLAGLGMAGAGIWGMAKGKKSERLVWEAIVAKMHANAAEAARDASDRYRTLEESMRLRVQGADRELDKERAKNRATLAAARSDADIMRQQLASYASGGGQAPEPACAADRERAATLGQLLADSVRVQEELAGAAEDHAASVRALLKAWPQ